MTVVDLLLAVRWLFEDAARFTQKALARRDVGDEVKPWSDEATCWCLLGALRAVVSATGTPSVLVGEAETALGRQAKRLGWVDEIDVNDVGGLDAVRMLLDRTIVAEGGQAPCPATP